VVNARHRRAVGHGGVPDECRRYERRQRVGRH
jgi:hypothetical protein